MKPFFAFFCRLTLFPLAGLFTEKIEGKENIPAKKNFILVSNHTSGSDHWFISNILRKRAEDLRFIGAMDSLKLLLQSGLLYYFSNTLVINRKRKNRKGILKKMIDCLKNNKIVIIYPEGDSNKKKELLRGKTGMSELALRTGYPLIPLGIERVGNSFKKIIRVGEPMHFLKESQLLKKIENNQEEYLSLLREVTDKIMREISRLCKKPYTF